MAIPSSCSFFRKLFDCQFRHTWSRECGWQQSRKTEEEVDVCVWHRILRARFIGKMALGSRDQGDGDFRGGIGEGKRRSGGGGSGAVVGCVCTASFLPSFSSILPILSFPSYGPVKNKEMEKLGMGGGVEWEGIWKERAKDGASQEEGRKARGGKGLSPHTATLIPANQSCDNKKYIAL